MTLASKNLITKGACEVVLPAMGASFVYKAFAQPHHSFEEVRELFDQAHKEVLRIESKFTEFKKSEVSRINEQAGISKTQVDDETMSLLEKAREFFCLSDGLFDITYASRNKLWRESNDRKLSIWDKIRLRGLTDYSKVSLNPKAQTIYLPKKGMRIGFGGIGKGFAVDQAFEYLKKKGLINFCVNGSGDMRVHSHQQAPRLWKIGIRNPFQQDPSISAGLVQIENGSVSTSGSYLQNSPNDKTGKQHHIMAKAGYSMASPPLSCTVVGEKCISTDVWATIAMATSIDKGLALLNKNLIYGILIDRSGKSHLTTKALKTFGR